MLVVDKSKCNGDGVCAAICPAEAIELQDDGKAFIDMEKCMECFSCRDTCSMEAISDQ